MKRSVKEKQISIFLHALFESSDIAPAFKKNLNPIKILTHIYLYKTGCADIAKKIKFDSLPATKNNERHMVNKICNFFKDSDPHQKNDVASYLVQNYPDEVDCLCPDFILTKIRAIIKKINKNDLHEDHVEKLVWEHICDKKIYHKFLDNILLFIEDRSIENNNLAKFLTTKKADLKENTFYKWIIRQNFIQKLDYAELGLAHSAKMAEFVDQDKMLGTICFLDFATEDLKQKFHHMLVKKYKTSKMSDMFLELFSESRQKNELFGKAVVIFGFFIIMFKFDDFVDFYQTTMVPDDHRNDWTNYSYKDYCYKILEGFQSGIKSDYVSSHFRLSTLKDQDTMQKISFVFWKNTFLKEKIKHECCPIQSAQNKKIHKYKSITKDKINDRRLLKIIEHLFSKKINISVYSFKSNDPYINLECTPLKMENDGFLIFYNNKDLEFKMDSIPFSVKCRFHVFDDSLNKRYYVFETELMHVFPADDHNILKLNYPVEYNLSDRRLDRYIPVPSDIYTLSIWEANNDQPEMTIQKPPLCRNFKQDSMKILNISSGGIRLSFKTHHLEKIEHEFALQQAYIFKITLSYHDKPADIYLTAVVRNLNWFHEPEPEIEVGFQFIQEAFFSSNKKISWSDITKKGSWHIGSWIFGNNMEKCKDFSVKN